MGNKTELLFEAEAILGEGPVWCARRNRLFWVDILGQTINAFNPETLENQVFKVGQDVGAIVPRGSGGFILAVRDGFAHFESETGDFNLIIRQKRAGFRFNDGKCDPAGRFWAGTIADESKKATGSLYCLDTDLSIHNMIPEVRISNGLVWSLDLKKFYYIDTPTHQVVVYDYDMETGAIDNCQVAIKIDARMGMPDGMTIDEEGMVYIALWNGGAVARFDPNSGILLDKFSVPHARLVTSCTIGGADLDELYITTARAGLTEEDLEKQKFAGSLFKRKIDVRGVPAFEFKG